MYTVHLKGVDVEFSNSINAEKKDKDAFDGLFTWWFNPCAEGWEKTRWIRHHLVDHLGYRENEVGDIYLVNNGNTSKREDRPKKRR